MSTNSSEIDVVVYGDASAERTLGPSRLPYGTTSLDPLPKSYAPGSPEVAAFLSDLSAAGDVSLIPTGQCIKSVSFGTSTSITAGGKTSGDVQCLVDQAPAYTALLHDCEIPTGKNL